MAFSWVAENPELVISWKEISELMNVWNMPSIY